MFRALTLLVLCAGCATIAPPAPAPEPSPMVARFGERVIRQAEVDARAADELRKLEEQIYELRAETAEQLALEVLVAAAAQREGMAAEAWLERELEKTATPATDEEVRALFEKARARLPEGVTLADVRDRLVQVVERENKARQARDIFSRLKKAAGYQVVLAGPSRPRKVVEALGPARGEASAPVTIVEFADFECPFCSRAAETVELVLKAYGPRVRLVFRHFPLSFHPRAPKAAEATACADEQGRFWQLHDALFESGELEVDALKAQAQRVGVDVAKFDQCLDSGRLAPLVKRDQAAGARLGVTGTPAFFINGVMLSGAQPEEAFRKLIDAELEGR